VLLALLTPALAASPCAPLAGAGPDDFGEGPSPRAQCDTARVLGIGGAGLAAAGAATVTTALLADPERNWGPILAGGGAVALGVPLMIAGGAAMADVARDHRRRVVKWPAAVAWATYGAGMAGLLTAVPTSGNTLPAAAVALGGAVGFGAAQWAVDTAAWKHDDVEIVLLPTGVYGTF
jgi:hypothetical protein